MSGQGAAAGASTFQVTPSTLIVTGYPKDLEKKDLRSFFQKFGRVRSVMICQDRRTGEKSGFCFVKYYRKESAEKVLQADLKMYESMGDEMLVAYAPPQRGRAEGL